MDAFYERPARHDVDYVPGAVSDDYERPIERLLAFQGHPLYQDWMALLSTLYIFLIFVEPAHLHSMPMIDDMNSDVRTATFWIELLVMTFFFIELTIEGLLLRNYWNHMKNSTQGATTVGLMKAVAQTNKLNLLRICLDFVFVVDFTVHWSMFPYNMFRFTRLLRPSSLRRNSVCLMVHSVRLMKSVRGFIRIMNKVDCRSRGTGHHVVLLSGCPDLRRGRHPVHARREHSI